MPSQTPVAMVLQLKIHTACSDMNEDDGWIEAMRNENRKQMNMGWIKKKLFT